MRWGPRTAREAVGAGVHAVLEPRVARVGREHARRRPVEGRPRRGEGPGVGVAPGEAARPHRRIPARADGGTSTSEQTRPAATSVATSPPLERRGSHVRRRPAIDGLHKGPPPGGRAKVRSPCVTVRLPFRLSQRVPHLPQGPGGASERFRSSSRHGAARNQILDKVVGAAWPASTARGTSPLTRSAPDVPTTRTSSGGSATRRWWRGASSTRTRCAWTILEHDEDEASLHRHGVHGGHVARDALRSHGCSRSRRPSRSRVRPHSRSPRPRRRLGIVHRDLKPDNIFLLAGAAAADGRPRSSTSGSPVKVASPAIARQPHARPARSSARRSTCPRSRPSAYGPTAPTSPSA